MKDYLKSLSVDQLLQTMPSGLFVVDKNGIIVLWNAAAERLTGYPAAEVLGQSCQILNGFPCGRHCGLFDPNLPKPLSDTPCSIRARDGRRLSLLKNIDLLRDQNNEVVGGIESFIDITPRRRLQRQLRRQASHMEQEVRRRTAELEKERSRLYAFLDAMDDLACIISEDLRVEFMNRAMIERFGEHLGESCYGAFHNLAEPCSWCPFPLLAKGEAEAVRNEKHFAAMGRTYEVLHTPMRDSAGRLQKLSVYRDITERKQVEEKLRDANRELDAFVGTVAHDLRAPLTPIIGFASFLRSQYGPSLNDEARDLLQEIEVQAERMDAIMEDLLELSRVGKIEAAAEPLPLRPVVERVLADFTEQLRLQGFTVLVAELPTLRVPETYLFELFTNLVGNILRYGAGEQPLLEIGGSRQSGGWQLFVRDHGPGIPEAEREQVFEPFYRGKAVRNSAGTGIGLATVHKIVRLAGGHVRVEETPGGGCTFIIEIPD
jgi:PAS domain S-box-containing protein